MSLPKKIKTIPEAPESNAGDDFHVLWTVRKSFELLNFDKDGLKAITIEGIDPNNSKKLDETGGKLLGVDIAEYFGGENFASAKKVVISQLKYSTRRVDQDWTFSLLYDGKKGKTSGSVIHRFAQIFSTFLNEFGRTAILEKLKIKLVSNRNISANQKQILSDIQDFLKSKKSKTRLSTLIKKFPNRERILNKLKNASELSSTDFVDFLRLLDFEDCGTGSREYHKIRINRSLRKSGIYNLQFYGSLFQLVWQRMQPEAIENGKNKVTKIDLLDTLQTSLERLFPVSNRFEKIDYKIHREQVDEIMKLVIGNNSGKPICLHGGAGIGKSTTSQLLAENFPSTSEIFLFDCYGEGTYLNPSDSRHLHKEAIVQIANEIAKSLGSAFLLYSDLDSYRLIKELKKRLKEAIEILRQENDEAVLVVLIDAADNSVTAAERNGTKSFIEDLANEPMPKGCRLVFTTRTHRIDSLQLPTDTEKIELKPFGFEETKKHLTNVLPGSSSQQINDFHQLTKGNPRVQAYALDLKKQGIKQVINYLKPNGKTVSNIISDKIVEAAKRIGPGGEKIMDEFFSYLINLPRPVPLQYLCEATNLSKDSLVDISTDIWHGLILEEEKFSFRDEDFENYIREKYQSSDDIRKTIANLFYEKAEYEEYASINIGLALHKVRRHKELADIVINNRFDKFPVDVIRKREVCIERTKLAMKASNKIGDNLAFFKLAFIAADTAKTDTALTNLLINNPEIVASLGAMTSLHKIHIKSKELNWAGAFHYQLAAIYSRNSKTIEVAKVHFVEAEKWLNWFLKYVNKDNHRNIYGITDTDIANGTEAILRIQGIESAVVWLSRWSPKSAVFRAAEILFNNVRLYSSKEEIIEWSKYLHNSIISELLLFKNFPFLRVEHLVVDRLAERILRLLKSKKHIKYYFLPHILLFCEYVMRSKSTSSNIILEILERVNTSLPNNVPYFNGTMLSDEKEVLQVDIAMRTMTLFAALTDKDLEISQIYPEKYTKLEEREESPELKRIREDKIKFDRFYEKALPIYQLRAAYFTNKNKGKLLLEFERITQLVNDDWQFRYEERHWSQQKLNFLASVLVETLEFCDEKYQYIETIISSFDSNKQKSIQLRTRIAAKMVRINSQRENTYFLLNEIEEILQKYHLTASETVDFYVQLAKIVSETDKDLSKYYFDKAIKSVSEIDMDAQEQIKCVTKLAEIGLPKNNVKLAFEFARFIEFCKTKIDGDNFPLSEGLNGVSYLDMSSGFLTLSRWSHRYSANFSEHILEVLQSAVDKKFIAPEIASALLPLNIYYWKSYLTFIQTTLEALNQRRQPALTSQFIDVAFDDVRLNCGSSEIEKVTSSMLEMVEGNRSVDTEVVRKIKSFNTFLTSIKIEPETYAGSSSISKIREIEEKEDTDTVVFPNIDIFSSKSISEAVRKLESSNESYNSVPLINDFLSQIMKGCSPADYIRHLEALADMNSDSISFYIFKNAIEDRLEKWGKYPLIREWKKNNFERVLKTWLTGFFWNESIDFKGIKKFSDLFSINEGETEEIIFNLLPEKIEYLEAPAIYQCIAFFRNKLSKEENEKLLEWVLLKSNDKIPKDFGDGEYNNNFISPTTPDAVVAGMIRYILGHPDKRLRWRGLHSLRRIICSKNTSILRILLLKQNETDCHPFQHKEFPFFWMSAKLYLWVGIARLSHENSNAIEIFKDEIIKETKNEVLPHVLIRYFVKQSALNLYKNNTNLFSEEEILHINRLNESQLPIVEDVEKKRNVRGDSILDECKFDFDSMDTLPYWYSNLGDCFNLGSHQVARIADKYISEIWGYSGDARKDNHVTEDYDLTGNRQGSLPTVENLRKYYEYHAMYSAASELLISDELAYKDGEYRSWNYWLKSEALTWSTYWLSDLRDALPLNRRLWIKQQDVFDEKWVADLKLEDYFEVMNIGKNSTTDTIILNSNYTQYFGKNYESVSVSSALVSTKHSKSLLRALQTANSHRDYLIPLEDNDLEINKDDFKLLGWLRHTSSQYSGIDEKDPFANKINSSFITLGEIVSKHFDIRFSDNNKHAFYEEKIISSLQNWSNEKDYKGYSDIQSHGSLLSFNIEFLLSFLKEVQMSLIVECVIDRTLESRRYDFNTPETINKAKLFLIDETGKITTANGESYQIGS